MPEESGKRRHSETVASAHELASRDGRSSHSLVCHSSFPPSAAQHFARVSAVGSFDDALGGSQLLISPASASISRGLNVAAAISDAVSEHRFAVKIGYMTANRNQL